MLPGRWTLTTTDPAEPSNTEPPTDLNLLAAARRAPGRWARRASDVVVGTAGPDEPGRTDLATGAPFVAGHDVDVPGTLPLRLFRRFDADPARPPGLLGPGWCSTLDVRLIVDDRGAALVLGDGAVVLFGPRPDPATERFSAVGADDAAEVRESVSGPVLRLTPDGLGGHRVFEPVSECTWHFPDSEDGTVFPVVALTDTWGNRVMWGRTDEAYVLEHSAGTRVMVTADGTDDGGGTARVVVVDPTSPDVEPVSAVLSLLPPVGTSAADSRTRHHVEPSGNGFVATTEEDGAIRLAVAFDGDLRARRWVSSDSGEVSVDVNHRGQPLRIASGGVERRLVRAPAGEVVVDEVAGREWTIEYEAPGRPVAAIGPRGRRVSAVWDGDRRPVSVSVGAGVHEFVTDPCGALARIGFPGGGTTLVDVDVAGRPVRVTDPDGYEVTIVRDVLGRPTRLVTPGAGTWPLDDDREVPPDSVVPGIVPPDVGAQDSGAPDSGAPDSGSPEVTATVSPAGRATALHVSGWSVFLTRHPDGSVAGAVCGRASTGGGGEMSGGDDDDNADTTPSLSRPGLDPAPLPRRNPGDAPATRVLCDPDSAAPVALLPVPDAMAGSGPALVDPPGVAQPGTEVDVVYPDGRRGREVVPPARITAITAPEQSAYRSRSPFEELRTIDFLRGRAVPVTGLTEWVRTVDVLVTRPGDSVAAMITGAPLRDRG